MGHTKVGRLCMWTLFANCRTLYKDMYESVYKPTTLWPTMSKNQLCADNPVNSEKNHSWSFFPKILAPRAGFVSHNMTYAQ